jgi:hypothetical protein
VQWFRGGPRALRLMRNLAAGGVGAARFFIFSDGCRGCDAADGAGGVAWESRKDRTAPVG